MRLTEEDEKYLRTMSEEHVAIMIAAETNLTYDQLAAQFKVAPGTVRSRLSRARDRLETLRLNDANRIAAS
jgi:DNA-directed RNA polymerase specialized sigma24 family protein